MMVNILIVNVNSYERPGKAGLNIRYGARVRTMTAPWRQGLVPPAAAYNLSIPLLFAGTGVLITRLRYMHARRDGPLGGDSMDLSKYDF